MIPAAWPAVGSIACTRRRMHNTISRCGWHVGNSLPNCHASLITAPAPSLPQSANFECEDGGRRSVPRLSNSPSPPLLTPESAIRRLLANGRGEAGNVATTDCDWQIEDPGSTWKQAGGSVAVCGGWADQTDCGHPVGRRHFGR